MGQVKLFLLTLLSLNFLRPLKLRQQAFDIHPEQFSLCLGTVLAFDHEFTRILQALIDRELVLRALKITRFEAELGLACALSALEHVFSECEKIRVEK